MTTATLTAGPSQELVKLIIRKGEGKTREMTFEEVYEAFHPMMVSIMRRANNKFVYNRVEEDDFMQIMDLELWKAFEQYDPSHGFCFSTYLHHKMKKGCRDATYFKFSQKNQHNGVISMNAELGDQQSSDFKLEDALTDTSDAMEGMDVEVLKDIIKSCLEPKDMDILPIILDVKNFPLQVYADKHGITRQAAQYRVAKLKEKLRAAIEKDYLGI